MTEAAIVCPACGYPKQAETCGTCAGSIQELTSKTEIRPGPRFFLFDIMEGLMSPFLAMLTLMTRKQYIGKLKWVVLANLVAFLLIVVGAWFGLYEFFAWLTPSFLVDWFGEWFAGVVAFVVTVVAVFFLAPVIIETVTSPFLDPLAEATEELMSGTDMPAVDRGVFGSIMFGIANSAKLLAIQVTLLVPCILFSFFIPGFFLVAFLIAAYLNALVWFDIPVSRRGLGMAYRRKIIQKNWARALGFGLGFQLGLFVPFFNFLFLTPATAVAVSELYFKFDKPEQAIGARALPPVREASPAEVNS